VIGGQVYTVGFDIGHPKFSGVLRVAKEQAKQQVAANR
jgi:hypothetical protein